jgi:hypothetical protein
LEQRLSTSGEELSGEMSQLIAFRLSMRWCFLVPNAWDMFKWLKNGDNIFKYRKCRKYVQSRFREYFIIAARGFI